MTTRVVWTALTAIAVLTACNPARAQNVSVSAGQLIKESQILGVEEEFRRAKLKNDTDTLDHLLSAEFWETNQHGATRNKADVIELFRTFHIDVLTNDASTVRFVADNLALVNGSQTETRITQKERMLFTRLWIREADAWRLLSSTQFRDPGSSAFSRLTRIGGPPVR